MPDDAPRRWLADFSVASVLKMPDATPTMRYDDPSGAFEAHLSNAAADAEDHALRLRIILAAADQDTAQEAARLHADRFLHLLTFVTQLAFRIVRLHRLVDWTPGLKTREMTIFYVRPSHQIIDDLPQEFLTSAAVIAASAGGELASRAMRWFAAAVRAPIMADQFQYFWFVVELLAASAGAERVTDKCTHCRTDLYCPTCDGPSTHRPYPAQRIRQFLLSLGVPEGVVTGLEGCRHRLMHGATQDELEEFCATLHDEPDFQHVIDAMGEAAWRAINTTITIPETVQELHLSKPDTYVSKTLTLRAFFGIGYPGDPDNPSIDDLNCLNPEVSLIERDAAGNETTIKLKV